MNRTAEELSCSYYAGAIHDILSEDNLNFDDLVQDSKVYYVETRCSGEEQLATGASSQ